MEKAVMPSSDACQRGIMEIEGALGDLCDRMDDAYLAAADFYGFICNGCEDNCCLTRFYHHTLAEYLYLLKGFSALDPDERNAIRERAAAARRKMALSEVKGAPPRMMCPLNVDERCRLYPYRPMICRLHGISHEIRKPDGALFYGPGCAVFSRLTASMPYHRFDRTPFYAEMAQLEHNLRREMNYKEKVRMTIADMIGHFPEMAPASPMARARRAAAGGLG